MKGVQLRCSGVVAVFLVLCFVVGAIEDIPPGSLHRTPGSARNAIPDIDSHPDPTLSGDPSPAYDDHHPPSDAMYGDGHDVRGGVDPTLEDHYDEGYEDLEDEFNGNNFLDDEDSNIAQYDYDDDALFNMEDEDMEEDENLHSDAPVHKSEVSENEELPRNKFTDRKEMKAEEVEHGTEASGLLEKKTCQVETELVWNTKMETGIYATPAIDLMVADDSKHVVIGGFKSQLQLLSGDGHGYSKFPYYAEETYFHSSPLLRSVKNEHEMDIVWTSVNGEIYIVGLDGFMKDGPIHLPKLKVRKNWYKGVTYDKDLKMGAPHMDPGFEGHQQDDDPRYRNSHAPPHPPPGSNIKLDKHGNPVRKPFPNPMHDDSPMPSDIPPGGIPTDGMPGGPPPMGAGSSPPPPPPPPASNIRRDDQGNVVRDPNAADNTADPTMTDLPPLHRQAGINTGASPSDPNSADRHANMPGPPGGVGGHNRKNQRRNVGGAGRRLLNLNDDPDFVDDEQNWDELENYFENLEEPLPDDIGDDELMKILDEADNFDDLEDELENGDGKGMDEMYKQAMEETPGDDDHDDSPDTPEDDNEWLDNLGDGLSDEARDSMHLFTDEYDDFDHMDHFDDTGDVTDDPHMFRSDSYYGDEEYVYVDPHVMATPVLVDVNGDGTLDLIMSVSYFFDEDDYKDLNHRASLGADVDIKKYVAGGLVAYDLHNDTVIWREQLDLSTDETDLKAFIYGSPTVIDLDGDGDLEVIVGTSLGFIYALHAHTGALLPGFPLSMSEIQAQVTASDVNGDGKMELVAVDNKGNVLCFNKDGKELWETRIAGFSAQGATYGDINGDGILDVVLGTVAGQIWALNGVTGEVLPNFPIKTAGRILAPVTIVNLDVTSVMAPGLHLVVPSFDGFVYIIDGRSGCTTKIDIGEKSYCK